MYLLTLEDIESIFASSALYVRHSFFVIDPETKTYQTDRAFESLVKYATFITESFLAGRTIIVKDLEKVVPKLKTESLKFGLDVDVHMYLVPKNGGDSFDFHTDDRDVILRMVYGTKEFLIKKQDIESSTTLKPGMTLSIPKGTFHKAINKGPSCLLSFGANSLLDYYVPGGIDRNILLPSPTGV